MIFEVVLVLMFILLANIVSRLIERWQNVEVGSARRRRWGTMPPAPLFHTHDAQ
jgi:hypothetical protein